MQLSNYPPFPTFCQPLISGGLSNLAKNHEASSAEAKAALEGGATALLPVLFKLVSETPNGTVDTEMAGGDGDEHVDSREGHRVRHILSGISALARLAPSDFLKNLFQKLMHRLVEEIQSDDDGNNLKLCSLLSLSEALVSSKVLGEDSIQLLYRALKPPIMNDNYGTRAQKRAYRVLLEICKGYREFILDINRLRELTKLLANTLMTAQIAARYMRLKCLKTILEGLTDDQQEQLVSVSSAKSLSLHVF